MDAKRLVVLFASRRNSARSILAESLLNELGKPRFLAMSAGAEPATRVHPIARELLTQRRHPTDYLRPKHWREFVGPCCPQFDFVIELADFLHGEVPTQWAGNPIVVRWTIDDPLATVAAPNVLRTRFLAAYTMLEHRLRILTQLRLDALDRHAVEQNLADGAMSSPPSAA